MKSSEFFESSELFCHQSKKFGNYCCVGFEPRTSQPSLPSQCLGSVSILPEKEPSWCSIGSQDLEQAQGRRRTGTEGRLINTCQVHAQQLPHCSFSGPLKSPGLAGIQQACNPPKARLLSMHQGCPTETGVATEPSDRRMEEL